jgi:hypothetical protein
MNEVITSWKQAILPCWEYYNNFGNAAGGNLHIVLDDGNLEDDSIEFCKTRCEGWQSVWTPGPPAESYLTPSGHWEDEFNSENKDEAGLALCELLLRMSMTQRKKLYKNYEWYCYGARHPSNHGERSPQARFGLR